MSVTDHKLQDKPDVVAVVDNGHEWGSREVKPLATMRNSTGEVQHIILGHGFYVLISGLHDGPCRTVSHWCPVAARALANIIGKSAKS